MMRPPLRSKIKSRPKFFSATHRTPPPTSCNACGMDPLERNPSISSSLKPSSFSSSSLCSPISGARRAARFWNAVHCQGLLTVSFSPSPAPSIGTMISFARAGVCGHFAAVVNDAISKVSSFENFVPVRHRLCGEDFVENGRKSRRIPICFAGHPRIGHPLADPGWPIPAARAGQSFGCMTIRNQ